MLYFALRTRTSVCYGNEEGNIGSGEIGSWKSAPTESRLSHHHVVPADLREARLAQATRKDIALFSRIKVIT